MRIENLDERHFYESVIESAKLMDYIFKEWNMINSVDMKGLVNYGNRIRATEQRLFHSNENASLYERCRVEECIM